MVFFLWLQLEICAGAVFGLGKYLTVYNHENIRREFMNDKFAKMRWLVTKFEENARKHYRHTPLVCIDETLRNYYGTYKCDFKVYMPDKPGKYGILFKCLADAEDRYVSRVLPYAGPPPGTEKDESQSIHETVIEMWPICTTVGRMFVETAYTLLSILQRNYSP